MQRRDFPPLALLFAFAVGLGAHWLFDLHFITLWLGVIGIIVTSFSVVTALAVRELPQVELVNFSERLPSTWVRVVWAVFGMPAAVFLLRGTDVGLGIIMIAMLAATAALVGYVEHRLKVDA